MLSKKIKVQVYGSGTDSKEVWGLIRCHACHKPLCHSNFIDDETFLCPDCFRRWNGKSHPTEPCAIEIDIEQTSSHSLSFDDDQTRNLNRLSDK